MCDWLNPPNPPINALNAPIRHKVDLYEEKKLIMIVIGAIFCQVISKAAETQFSLFITDGNQKCMGANPSFIHRPNKGNKDIKGWRVPIKIKVDPIAWNKRYFSAASGSWPQEEEDIKGRKEIMLISNDIQIISQWEEEIAMKVLTIKDIKNKFI